MQIHLESSLSKTSMCVPLEQRMPAHINALRCELGYKLTVKSHDWMSVSVWTEEHQLIGLLAASWCCMKSLKPQTDKALV